MNEPAWLTEARKHIGTRELKGSATTPEIATWWKTIKRGGIKDDETPWCAAFAGAMLEIVGVQSTRFESAKSYLAWGVPLNQPEVGCIVVFNRDGGGHVGFVVGRDCNGHLMVLGGNQGDEVNLRAFDYNRVAGYRWPAGQPLPAPASLPVLALASLSTNEA